MDKPVSEISTRLAAFRSQLEAQGLAGFIVPLTDEHQSEYVPAYAQRLAWLTGFTGSAGSAIVLPHKAAVFTDGRYTLQIDTEVDGDLFERLNIADDPPFAWLKANAGEGQQIGYDPLLHTTGWVAEAEEALAAARATLVAVDINPVDRIWSDQPAEPLDQIAPHDIQYTGRSAAAKRTDIADQLVNKGADAVVLSALDSIAWAFNIRGRDVTHTPVALSFALLHKDGTAELFTHPDKVTTETRAALGNAVTIRDKGEFIPALNALGQNGKAVMADPDTASAAIFGALRKSGARVIKGRDPCLIPKACKNAVEIAGTRSAHERDGAAVTRFLHWLSESVASGNLDDLNEISLAEKLNSFRSGDPLIKDKSFETISGSGPNGAICHYRVSAASNRSLKAGELYLVDSGAQYLDGTTDITRTVAISDLNPGDEERDRFTRVLKGHIALATCIFPAGTTGTELDSFARRPLWEAGLDYDHGTGHGVGSYLAVHEGPGRISKAPNAIALRPGMIFSNEPGYYKAGAYGIRIENLVLVKNVKTSGDREMFGFEELTLAPLDRRLIEAGMLNAQERAWLDNYHIRVRETLSPMLPDDARAWLEAETVPIR